MEITSLNPRLSADRKLRRPVLMLKDYLLDDFSSCSSNGFKSFPRRPSQKCCPSTAKLVDFRDAAVRRTSGSKRPQYRDRTFKRSPSSKAAAALLRVSQRVINAVKLLPFPSAIAKSATSLTSQSQSKPRQGLLPRSISRKLLSKRFWRKAASVPEETEIGQWRLFRDILAEKDTDPTPPPPPNKLDVDASRTAVAALTPRLSTSSSSHRDGGSSWDSEFGAVDTVSTFSGNSVSSDGDGAVLTEKDSLLPPKPSEKEDEKVSARVGVTVGGNENEEELSPGATPTARSKQWSNEEKEQFSPVSTLDCPFKDEDDEETSSISECSPVHAGGSRKKHGGKTHRIKSLEPLNLDGRLAFSRLDDGVFDGSALQSYTSPSSNHKESDISLKAEELLRAIKMNNPVVGLEEDNILCDFFIEKLELGLVTGLEAMKVAKDWLNGMPRDLWMGWEVKSGRSAYVRDMDEKCRSWRGGLKEEHEEVTEELEAEVWSSLMEEIMLDL